RAELQANATSANSEQTKWRMWARTKSIAFSLSALPAGCARDEAGLGRRRRSYRGNDRGAARGKPEVDGRGLARLPCVAPQGAKQGSSASGLASIVGSARVAPQAGARSLEGARRGGWLGRREGANRSVARCHVRIRARPRTTPDAPYRPAPLNRRHRRPGPGASHECRPPSARTAPAARPAKAPERHG